MTTISPDALYQRKEDLVFGEIDGDLLILNIATDRFLHLNDVAGRIFDLLEHQKTFIEIFQILQTEYDVEADVCHKQLTATLEEFRNRDLLVEPDQ